MIEPLEGRCLYSVDTSSVGLYAPDGSPASIDRHRAAWFIVHGANESPSQMGYMAGAVAAASPRNEWQVIGVDWSKLASNGSAGSNSLAVGDRLAALIRAARLPVARVNLIAFSMGTSVVGRVAADLKTRTTQVNRIVALDPGGGPHAAANFAANSAYSIAFSAGDDGYGDPANARTADVTVQLTGLTGDGLTRHGDVFLVAQTMWRRDDQLVGSGNDQVSPLFSIQSILQGQQLSWKQNQLTGGYDAQVSCGYQPGWPDDLGPMSMTYVDRRGKVRRVT